MKKFIICFVISIITLLIIGLFGEDNINAFGSSIGLENIFGIEGYSFTSLIILIFAIVTSTIMFQVAYQIARVVIKMAVEIPIIGIGLVFVIVPTIFFLILLSPFILCAVILNFGEMLPQLIT